MGKLCRSKPVFNFVLFSILFLIPISSCRDPEPEVLCKNEIIKLKTVTQNYLHHRALASTSVQPVLYSFQDRNELKQWSEKTLIQTQNWLDHFKNYAGVHPKSRQSAHDLANELVVLLGLTEKGNDQLLYGSIKKVENHAAVLETTLCSGESMPVILE